MPGGNAGAGSGANGSRSSSAAFGAGDCPAGDDADAGPWVWAWADSWLTPKNEMMATTASKEQHCALGSSFLLRNFFLQHGLHNPDLGPMGIVSVVGKVKHFGVLSRARGVKQVLHH